MLAYSEYCTQAQLLTKHRTSKYLLICITFAQQNIILSPRQSGHLVVIVAHVSGSLSRTKARWPAQYSGVEPRNRSRSAGGIGGTAKVKETDDSLEGCEVTIQTDAICTIIDSYLHHHLYPVLV
jgi:hypothetical protein